MTGVEIKTTGKYCIPHSYCFSCHKDNVETFDVTLSWRTHELICKDCLTELSLLADNILYANAETEGVKRKYDTTAIS